MSELELLRDFYRYWKGLHRASERTLKEQCAQRMVEISHKIDFEQRPNTEQMKKPKAFYLKPDYAEMAYGKDPKSMLQ